MSFVTTTIGGGILTKSGTKGQLTMGLFPVSETAYGMPDAYIHLTKEQAAQWAAVLNEFAEEAE